MARRQDRRLRQVGDVREVTSTHRVHMRRQSTAVTIVLGLVLLAGPSCRDGRQSTGATTTDLPAEASGTGRSEPTTTTVGPAVAGGTFDTTSGPVTLACEGSGTVPVVLIAGTDDPVARWDSLVGALGPEVLTCRHVPSRAASLPATPTVRSDALAEALRASALPGPYLLVAHSLGAATVRRFGDRHPDLLGGALLLDGTTPLALLSLDDVLIADGWDPVATRADVEAPATWPPVPLSVLAHDPAGEPLGLGPAVEALWTEGQQTYVALTGDASFEQVPGTGHAIDLDAPGRVVAEIARLLEAVDA